MARGSRYGYRQSNQSPSNLSQREQLYMEDVMGALRLTSTKYQYYAGQCRNGDIQQLCQHIAQHQQSDLQQIQSMTGQGTGQFQ